MSKTMNVRKEVKAVEEEPSSLLAMMRVVNVILNKTDALEGLS